MRIAPINIDLALIVTDEIDLDGAVCLDRVGVLVKVGLDRGPLAPGGCLSIPRGLGPIARLGRGAVHLGAAIAVGVFLILLGEVEVEVVGVRDQFPAEHSGINHGHMGQVRDQKIDAKPAVIRFLLNDLCARALSNDPPIPEALGRVVGGPTRNRAVRCAA